MTERVQEAAFRHAAWLYRGPAEYLGGVRDFVLAALAGGEPIFVVVPASQLPEGWLPRAPGVMVADMKELGGNPARLIPALSAFADRHRGRRVRYLAEPAWVGRSEAELRETARYETLLNRAFAHSPITALCPYNAAELSADAIEDACAAHPALGRDGNGSNPAYRGTAVWPDSLTSPLLAPANAQTLSYHGDLQPVRALVAAVAGSAELSSERSTDLVIAASEVAANTLRHTSRGGVVRLWVTEGEVLCQIEDAGHISDPLAGHWRPTGDLTGHQGLWLVNQVCDLAEIRSSELGTTVRLHMYRR